MSFFRSLVLKMSHRWIFRLSDWKNRITGGYAHKHFSQFGEDVFLVRHFKNRSAGFYVDVGAHHPMRYSNTQLLHAMGWSGINIDPNPYTIRLFNAYRPRAKNVQSAVDVVEGELTYYTFSDPAINTCVPTVAQRWQTKKWVEYLGAIQIPVRTLGSICKEFVPVGTKIQVLNVDVEGLDLGVLQSHNWQDFSPEVIIVESHDAIFETLNTHPIYQFLHERGYTLVSWMSPGLIFLYSNSKNA